MRNERKGIERIDYQRRLIDPRRHRIDRPIKPLRGLTPKLIREEKTDDKTRLGLAFGD